VRHGRAEVPATSATQALTVFLDRDGVINRKREGSYVRSWEEFEFLPRAKDALRRLVEAGCRIIVVTNQRGVARGDLSEADLSEIHDRMLEEARLAGGPIDAVYYCPHESASCDCRKPGTGLFLEAQRDFTDIHFPNSIVIGDSLSDMEAGQALGCETLFIGESERHPNASTLYDAVERVVTRAGRL
jgi:histidinol-phosphate phosphatase family protein